MSKFFRLNLSDVQKAFFLALLTVVCTSIYQYINTCGFACIDWNLVLKTTLKFVVIYLGKNFLTNSNGAILKGE